MKKQFTTKMKVFTALGVLSTMSLTAIATPIMQEVSATLRKDVTFTINGESSLEGASTLVYNDTTYIPVRALVEELGLNVNYDNGNISISTPAVELPASEIIGEDTSEQPVLEEVELKDVEIVEINGNSLTVGNIEDPSNLNTQTIIHLKDETPIVHERNKRLYTQEDLEVGQKLTVIHEPIMTLSLPGQTTAIKIILMD